VAGVDPGTQTRWGGELFRGIPGRNLSQFPGALKVLRALRKSGRRSFRLVANGG
jgi:hypothetical protein